MDSLLTVTQISKDKRNFYKIKFSNGESIKLSEDLLVRYRLLKGQEITEEELESIKRKTGYDLGLQLAMNYLSYQMHSEKELLTYLKQKEIETKDRSE